MFIGYLPKLPPGYHKPVALSLLAILIIFAGGIALFGNAERPLPNAHFEFGQLSEHEGFLQLSPYPMLQIEIGKDPSGKTIFQSLLLVNSGKLGAKAIVQKIADEATLPLETSLVKLRGSLIYYDGKTVLELTEGDDAYLGITKVPEPDYSITRLSLGEKTYQGEIVDPKCFFGVMNPGYGKVHLSCARRCLSGGIPPVLKLSRSQEEVRYLLLTNSAGEPLGMEILPLVGFETTISGQLSQRNDWHYLAIDDEVISRLSAKAVALPTLYGQIPICR